MQPVGRARHLEGDPVDLDAGFREDHRRVPTLMSAFTVPAIDVMSPGLKSTNVITLLR